MLPAPQMQTAKATSARTKSASILNPFAIPLALLDKLVKLENAPSALVFLVSSTKTAIRNTARTALASLSLLKIANPMTTASMDSASIKFAAANRKNAPLNANPVRHVFEPLAKIIPEPFASKMTNASPESVQKTSANSRTMRFATLTTTACPACASDTLAENLPMPAPRNVRKIRPALTTSAKELTAPSA